eukprot:bmy_06232T0
MPPTHGRFNGHDMSPLRSQNYLSGCELKADKDYPFKVDNDENEHQLSLRTVSLGAGAKDELHIVEAQAMNYEANEDEDDDDDGDDFDDEEAEEKAPVKKSVRILQPKMHTNQTRMEKPQNHQHQNQKVKNPSENRKKLLKHRKGPSSVEDIKAKMQASIEKGGFPSQSGSQIRQLCEELFPMTDQEAIQDLWQWRKSL